MKDALETELAARPPTGVRSLPAQERDDLAAAIRHAKRRQTQALIAAGEQAMSHIPRALRGPIRRLFR